MQLAIASLIASSEFEELVELVEKLSLSVLSLPVSKNRALYASLSDVAYFASLDKILDLSETYSIVAVISASVNRSMTAYLGRVFPASHLPEGTTLQAHPFYLPSSSQLPAAFNVEECLELVHRGVVSLSEVPSGAYRNSLTRELRSLFTNFISLVRVFASDDSLEDRLRPHFNIHVCSHFALFIEYFGGPAVGRQESVWLLTTLAELCKNEVSFAEKLHVSTIIGHRLANRLSAVGNRFFLGESTLEGIIEESLLFLQRDGLVLSGELTIDSAAGITREAWISIMANHLFTIDQERIYNLFEYIPDSEQTLRISDGADKQLIRAAGLLIGLALKYNVPISVDFAPSFIKGLGLIANLPSIQDFNLMAVDESVAGGSGDIFNGLGGYQGPVAPAQRSLLHYLGIYDQLFVRVAAEMAAMRDGIADVVGPAALNLLSLCELADRIRQIPEMDFEIPFSDYRRQDPCYSLDDESQCVDEYCTNLYWINEDQRVFFASNIAYTPFPRVSCKAAASVHFVYYAFDSTRFNQVLSDLHNLLVGSFLPIVQAFPIWINMDVLNSIETSIEAIRGALVGGSMEAEAAFSVIVDMEETLVVEQMLENLCLSVSTLPMQYKSDLYSQFSRILSAYELFGRALTDRMQRVLNAQRQPEVAIGTMQTTETPGMSDQSISHLRTSVGEASSHPEMDEVFQALASASKPVQQVLTTNGKFQIRIPSRTTGQQLVDKLRDFVQSQVADSRFETCICQHLKGLSALLYMWDFPDSLSLNSQLLALCKDRMDFTSKVAVSSLIGRKPERHLRVGISQYPPEKMMQESMAFLMDPLSRVGAREFAVAFDGNEIGYIGVRKVWINQLAEHLLTVNDQLNIFEFTDESRSLITVAKGASPAYLRAAGRLIGLALKFDVSISTRFSPSLIRALRIVSSQPTDVELEAMMRFDDNAFYNTMMVSSSSEFIQENPELFEFGGLGGFHGYVTPEQAPLFKRLNFAKKMFFDRSLQLAALRNGMFEVTGSAAFNILTEQELVDRLCSPTPLTPQIIWDGLSFPRFYEQIEHYIHSLAIRDDPEREALERQRQTLARETARECLRQVVFELDEEDLLLFNSFVTGIARRPVTDGPWIKVDIYPALGDAHLPRSHTCHNQFQLPLYSSVEVAREQILKAIRLGQSLEGHADYTTG